MKAGLARLKTMDCLLRWRSSPGPPVCCRTVNPACIKRQELCGLVSLDVIDVILDVNLREGPGIPWKSITLAMNEHRHSEEPMEVG